MHMQAMGAMPPELRTLRQWVSWRIEQRDGKPTKVPMNPHTGKHAAVDAPITWGIFVDALGAAARWKWAGVGFVFTAHDPFAGIDLDKVIDAQTGEMVHWAQQIINRVHSYTERSQSGTGVHILVQATLPPGRRRTGQIEMYDRGRFFVMTGHHVPGTPTTIAARQPELAALHAELFGPVQVPHASCPSLQPMAFDDQSLLVKMFAARNGEVVRRLWGGNTTGYASHSEADLALCARLAFWTGGDASRIDALFRQSGLYREDKWHNRDDYRTRTIAKALERQAFYRSRFRPGDADPWLGPRGSRRGIPLTVRRA